MREAEPGDSQGIVDLAVAAALTVETSGTPSFAAARAFYERCGFASVASVPDYWEGGDSLELYWRRL
ncbi:hypothetical protein [Leifsonia sp. AG29]|uniref:hypothetical protein n=1 Tax=Leifsonia sp. AG29 TaxID=2598860 RepID=UPI00131E0734|nr:hypothetical protein [Leifsonia sp. AG29]